MYQTRQEIYRSLQRDTGIAQLRNETSRTSASCYVCSFDWIMSSYVHKIIKHMNGKSLPYAVCNIWHQFIRLTPMLLWLTLLIRLGNKRTRICIL